MFLTFSNVKIKGFQSISEIELQLSGKGVVYVIGVNKYEDYTNSNGSGKSSVFESIFWCIYGKTSSGITDVKNKFYDGDCSVELDFCLDNVNYKIIRTDSTVSLFKESEDISGRNKTDTNKIILSVIGMDLDMFTSIIFLSQNFNGKFSTLAPAAKKERIEKLTGSQNYIDEFKSKFSDLKSEYVKKREDKLSEKGSLIGKIDYIKSEIIKNEQLLSSTPDSSEIPNLDQIRSAIKELQEVRDNYQTELSEKRQSNLKIDNNRNTLKSNISKYVSDKTLIENNLKSLNCGVCYACKQEINKELNENMISESNSKLTEIDDGINLLNSKLEKLDVIQNPIRESILDLEHKINAVSVEIKELGETESKYSKYSNINIDLIREDIENKKSELSKLKLSLVSVDSELNEFETEIAVIEHCISLISKQFRLYMLENVVDFLNNRLKHYSDLLYSNENDVIRVDSDFNIYLGDMNYMSLSGGERRKIDISLIFAQRDLSLNVLGVTSNLLILDEIYDNLDDKAISVVSDMISTIPDIDSMFVISHMQNVDIKYDSILKVVKGTDRLTTAYGLA